MVTVAPSLLSCNFMRIEEEVSLFNRCSDLWLHLDIMDGHFVPNLTFGGNIIRQMAQITAIPLDVHLMVNNPLFHLKMMEEYGVHNVTFHLESCPADKILTIIKYAKKYFPSVGLSIKPNTPVDAIAPDVIEELNLVLVMSVEPGFGGQAFMPSAYQKLDRLTELKKQYNHDLQLQVDGGVTDQNNSELIKHGATNLVAGSYVFCGKQDEYLTRVDSLRS